MDEINSGCKRNYMKHMLKVSNSGIIPNNLLLARFRPRIFFPLMICIWGSLCICNAAAKQPRDIMAIRFFQGYAESCVFAGTHLILGAWYTEEELGKRSAIFTSSGLAGGMFGGFLQTAIHQSMDGLSGLEGWRWLFIVRLFYFPYFISNAIVRVWLF